MVCRRLAHRALANRVIAGIGFDATALAAAADRTTGHVGHMPKLHSGAPRAIGWTTAPKEGHAYTVGQEHCSEVGTELFGFVPVWGLGDHITVVPDLDGHTKSLVQPGRDGQITVLDDRRPKQRAPIDVRRSLNTDDDPPQLASASRGFENAGDTTHQEGTKLIDAEGRRVGL